jgi:lipoprotein signal peptidase
MAKTYSFKNQWLKILVCFCAMSFFEFWLILSIKAYYYIHIQQQHISFWSYLSLYSPQWFLLNLIPLILLFLSGVVINLFAFHYEVFPRQLQIVLIIILIFIERAMQFIMLKKHDTINIIIIDGWLKINPIPIVGAADGWVSPKYSDSIYPAFYPITMIVSFFAYRFCYFFLSKQRVLLEISIVFFTTGAFGSVFNWLAYNHGYDYIEIEYFINFDIKDVYLCLWLSTVFLLLAEAIPYLKRVEAPKQKIIEYLQWERTTWRALFGRLKLFLQTHLKATKKG